MRDDERANPILGARASGERRCRRHGVTDLFFDDDSQEEPFERGFAVDGERLICVTYGPEEYRSLWGGDVEEYKDFLVQRREALNYRCGPWSSPEVIPIPFDRESFDEWLKQQADAAACPDPHGEWALSVYRNPDQLAAIRARHPLSYSVPTYEVLEVASCGWILPIVVRDNACIKRLGRTLPLQLIENVMKEFATRFLKNVIPLERLSPYRARGAAIIAADRLVPPDRAWSLCSELETRVASAFSTDPHELPSYLRVSSRWGPRSSAQNDQECPCVEVVEVLCLPLVIVGSSADVGDVGLRLSRIPCDAAVQACWNEFLLPLGARLRGDKFMLIQPAQDVGQVARQVHVGLEFEEEP